MNYFQGKGKGGRSRAIISESERVSKNLSTAELADQSLKEGTGLAGTLSGIISQ